MLRVNYDLLDWKPYESDAVLLAYYHEQLFTGIAFEHDAKGTLIGEVTFLEGQESGLKRLWSPSGVLLLERNMAFAGPHGSTRSWHDNGQLAEEGLTEFAFYIWLNRWDEGGELTEEYKIDEKQLGIVKRIWEGNLGQILRGRERAAKQSDDKSVG
jgi:antitoxin component YwqK of YwqJK toxin-antitoxin module